MRTCIGISVVIHAVVMLWLVFAPGVRTLGPANAEAIMVDLVPPQEAPAAAPTPPQSEDAKSADPKSGQAKSEDTKPEERKPELPRTATRKPDPTKPDPTKPDPTKPDPTKPDPTKPRPNNAEEQAATAARLAWLLNLPTETEASLAAPPSEGKSNLSSDEIADFKTQVSKCWVVPAGVPSTPGFDVLIRIALRPDGTLGTKPELVRAPASAAGPPLVDSAKRALQKCQPYATLPADRYPDWKILELTFTAQGPAGLSSPARP
jgi:hypothetical protein